MTLQLERLYGCAMVAMDTRAGLEVLLESATTVTELLERLAGEPVDARQRRHVTVPAGAPNDLEVPESHLLVRRSSVLRGRESGRAYLRAESLVVASRLPGSFMARLRTGRDPIGRIMASEGIEFRRILLPVREEAPTSSPAEPPGQLLVRRYRVEVGAWPVMVIEEVFLRSLEPLLRVCADGP